MKKILYILLIIIVFIPLIVNAQTGLTINAKHEKTLKRLEFAKDVEASFPNRNARNLLVDAENLLKKARLSISSARYLLANRQIDNANMLINNALKLILNNPIRRQREKLRELLQYAETVVVGSGDRKAEQFLQEAKDHNAKAIKAFMNKRYQLALEHFRLAIFLVNKAIDLAGNHNGKIRERALEEKKRLEQLFNKAKKTVDVSKNKTALKFLRLSEKQIQKTKKEMDNKNYVQAIEHYHKATRLLLRAIDIASGKNEKLAIRIYNEVAALDELIERVQNNIETLNIRKNNRLMFLSDRILELQRKAHEALEKKDLKAAQFNAQMARNLIERALQIINRKTGNRFITRAKEELKKLEINLEEISLRVDNSGIEEAKALLDLAYASKKRSQNFFGKGNKLLALGAIAIANKFAFAAEQLVMKHGISDINEDIINDHLQQVANTISKFKTEEKQMSTRDRLLLKEAEKMYIIANNAFGKGFLNVANECIQIAQRELNKIFQ